MSRAHTFKTLAAPALLSLCAALAAGQRPRDADATARPVADTQLGAGDEATNRLPLRLPLARPRLLVSKAARRLVLYDGDKAVRVYRVVLGFAPRGDKAREGDGRTPEGDFYVCMKNEKSRFYLSLGLNYPDRAAAARGLREGLITRGQHDRIVSAAREKRCPPWDTPLGGEIMIHGGGTAEDWTLGCVALENQHIQELFDAVPRGTAVRIEP